jgi:hypothetical protein
MIGSRLGCWVIEKEIGRGGMGTVYRARRAPDAPLGPPTAAIKVLAAELAVEVGFQQRFQREVDVLRQLDHPGIVRFFDSGQDDGRFWFAMEYVEGESYESLRDGRGRLPWPEVLDLAWQVAPALKHAHDRGVIHRDLKPSNLLRAADGRVKLTDFGIASLFASPHLTVTGGVIGTPEYLSPEQAAGKSVTKKSDLYSLGVVLYALVTGQTPFVGDPVDLLHKHRFGQFDRPGRIIPDLHPDFEEIICWLMEKDPAARPGDAGVLHRRLDSVRRKIARQSRGETDRPVGATPPASGREGPATLASRVVREELERQNRPGPIGRVLNNPIVLVLLFVLVVGTLAWTFWPTSERRLYERGARLMESDNPADWDRAWTDYLDPLEKKFPNHAYKEEVAELRDRYDELRAEREAEGVARREKPVSEARWFYEKGLRLQREGKEQEAEDTFKRVVNAYGDVPAERPWVRRAERALEGKGPKADAEYAELREALSRAKKLDEQGKADQAKAVREALAELYRDDPKAQEILRKE